MNGQTPYRRRPSRRCGMVLLVVVIVVAMVSLAGLSFVADMSAENKASRLRGAEMQADCVAGSGVEAMKALVATSQAGGGPSLVDNTEAFRGVVVQSPDRGGPRARFSVVSPKYEADAPAGVRFGLENESAKLNLNALVDWDEEHSGSGHAALMRLPGMTDSAADALLDWIDGDASPRQSGAEDEYYSGQGLPYGARNGPPASLDELLLVKDVSRLLLYGGDLNRNFFSESSEQRQADGAGGSSADNNIPWVSLLTVYSAERNVDPKGRPKINLNDRDLRQLHRQLLAAFDREQADFVVLYRQYGPSDPRQSSSRGNRVRTDMNLALAARFPLTSVLDLVGASVEIPETTKPSKSGSPAPPLVIPSPLEDDTSSLRNYLPKWLDYTTVGVEPVVRGRVNVDLAPRAVLLGVPGMPEDAVERILSTRGSQSSSSETGRRYATWLLTEGVLNLDQMREVLPYVTCGGDVFRAQVVGFFDESGPFARAEVVIDATVRPPRQVYWKNLRLLGRGFSAETLGAEPGTVDTPLDNG